MSITGHTLTLTWRDFRGHVPSAAKTDAFTSTSYNVRTTFTMRGVAGHESDFRLSTVSIQVTVNRGSMWSRRSARSADLLKHEQGHYDVTSLLMRDLHTDLTALLRAARTFPTQADLEQAIADLQDPIGALIAAIQSTSGIDGVYDRQTNHGRVAALQRTWNAAFAAARAGPATRLADALTARGVTLP